MPKRRNPVSGKRRFDADDDPIGLTSAFAPVKGPQSVDYDDEDDPVGLTKAFGVVTSKEMEDRDWDDENKWDGFNWAESSSDNDVVEEPVEQGEFVIIDEEDSDAESEVDDAVEVDATADADATEDEPKGATAPQPKKSGGEHQELTLHEAKKAEKEEEAEEDIEDDNFEEDDFLDDEDAVLEEQEAEEEKEIQKASKARRGKHGAHAAPEAELTPRMQKSKRTRRVLIVLVILLVVVMAALGYFAWRTITNSQQEAAQQTLNQTTNPPAATAIDQAQDATDTMTRLADVPNLSQLLGMTQDEALTAIGHGALVTSNREVNEDGNPIRTTLNVALTDEAADSRTGTPTVYLGLDANGRVCQAGYSASATSLGFSALSFADAVNTEHVIEKTLAKAGVTIPDGSAVLPEDKAAYTTYANDGTTIVRERCSFDGNVDVRGIPCSWSAVLSYDYTTQIVTGNLSDTVRIIYVYITQK